ncbi:MAG: hypothetical protein HC886_20520 [Leptolyngbyaceae cyanobacterium SM1_1_3]|nr:hypothetical protein [Leptolyngbyaceae cyanobacterium SM1_1_3]NJN03566.1 hypothetical protein [Leptolyngbyaceae cyanobacterium RM1_1_2]NJO11386.1 hypothetical protein [Leptolyngbyaceae cyanobacterium SL_1_1]
MKHLPIVTGLLSLSLSALSLPALAQPQIASGDRYLEDIDGAECLARADGFVNSLEIETTGGEIDRTGYFNDGVFRILCYDYGTDSMVIVFAAHDESGEVAAEFVRYALDSINY